MLPPPGADAGVAFFRMAKTIRLLRFLRLLRLLKAPLLPGAFGSRDPFKGGAVQAATSGYIAQMVVTLKSG